ncbi:MAG: response regulator [Anaerolineae bacterium]|nr:response regulator [Anaerolineae bacterium]
MERTKKVLVVEDSPVQAQALERVLERRGMEVLWAVNGKVGLAMACEHLPDVVVLDVEMPEMNGFEMCRALKQNPATQAIPVVMLTVRAEAEYVLEGLDLGAIDFIPKDVFSTQVLLETLVELHILDDIYAVANESQESR